MKKSMLKSLINEIVVDKRIKHLKDSVSKIEKTCERDFGIPILTEEEKILERKRNKIESKWRL